MSTTSGAAPRDRATASAPSAASPTTSNVGLRVEASRAARRAPPGGRRRSAAGWVASRGPPRDGRHGRAETAVPAPGSDSICQLSGQPAHPLPHRDQAEAPPGRTAVRRAPVGRAVRSGGACTGRSPHRRRARRGLTTSVHVGQGQRRPGRRAACLATLASASCATRSSVTSTSGCSGTRVAGGRRPRRPRRCVADQRATSSASASGSRAVLQRLRAQRLHRPARLGQAVPGEPLAVSIRRRARRRGWSARPPRAG